MYDDMQFRIFLKCIFLLFQYIQIQETKFGDFIFGKYAHNSHLNISID